MAKFDFDGMTRDGAFNFDTMTPEQLDALLHDTPEGSRVEKLLKDLRLDAALEHQVRAVVTQGMVAGAALLKKSLA